MITAPWPQDRAATPTRSATEPKVRDGQVANRPIYAAIGVSLDGEKDILGLWAGTGGEGARFRPVGRSPGN